MKTKQLYQEKMQAELNEWQSKIDTLKAKADKAAAEQKIKYYEEIESLRTKQQHAREKLDQLQAASEGAWEELKTGVELAWHDMQNAFERAGKKFK